ncbi:hypothetical protein KAJ89_02430 [Candidatus Parcubacteria bacterium]|nr:hypothetical protein [Candidatus Parcubacteria bacterium]
MKKEITFTVNGETFSTNEKELTAKQILEIASISTSDYYLILIKGNNQISYKDNPEELIKMHNNIKFIANYTGETPVA